MEVRQLKHFVEVARQQSFTAAAQELHIAQPALSISIKKFEQQLGVMLFRRDERKVSLTHEGEVLFEHALRILQQVEDAALAIDELKGLVKGEVKLGTPSMMGSYFFPEIIMAFKSQFPHLKMTVVEAGTQSIRDMLMSGELDLGVINNRDVPEDLEVDPLITSQMVAVVGNQHELAAKKAIDFDTFFSQELVTFKPGYFHRDFIDRVCKEHGYTPHFAFETNLLPMIFSIIEHEYAIAALLELAVDNEPRIHGVPFDPPVWLDLAWRRNSYLSHADRTFIEFVKRYV